MPLSFSAAVDTTKNTSLLKTSSPPSYTHQILHYRTQKDHRTDTLPVPKHTLYRAVQMPKYRGCCTTKLSSSYDNGTPTRGRGVHPLIFRPHLVARFIPVTHHTPTGERRGTHHDTHIPAFLVIPRPDIFIDATPQCLPLLTRMCTDSPSNIKNMTNHHKKNTSTMIL